MFAQILILAISLSNSFGFNSSGTSRNSLRARCSHQDISKPLTELCSTPITSTFRNAPNTFTSPSFLSFSMWPSDYGGIENELFYLPINSFSLPPRTDYFLRKVTNAYIESDVKDTSTEIDFGDIIDMIDSEYKWSSFEFFVGGKSYDFNGKEDKKQLKAWELFSKVISFAALYRLPKEVTIMLFDNIGSGNISYGVGKELKKMVKIFVNESWESISFPKGLSVRLRREYLQSSRERYSLIPRQSILTKTQNSLQASDAITQARFIRPPPKLVQKEDIVAEIDEIAREFCEKSEFVEEGDSQYKEMLTFFPRENKIFARLVSLLPNKVFARLARFTSKQSQRLQTAGRAGLISYGFLNFMWYTLAIIWRWNRLSTASTNVLVQGRVEALGISVRKFANVLVSVYVGSQITKLPRLSLAIALTPLGDKTLNYTRHKLKVSTDKALGILTSSLVGLCLGVWAIIVFGDATFSRSSLGTFAM